MCLRFKDKGLPQALGRESQGRDPTSSLLVRLLQPLLQLDPHGLPSEAKLAIDGLHGDVLDAAARLHLRISAVSGGFDGLDVGRGRDAPLAFRSGHTGETGVHRTSLRRRSDLAESDDPVS